jgi:ketosteroid isomerase-like protein
VARENVEVAKQAMTDFGQRDLRSYEELFTPDFEWLPALPMAIESEGYQGRDGVERYFEEISDTWEAYSVIPDEYRDVGNSVLMIGRFEARGKASGVAVHSPLAAVFEFHDGRCSRARAFLDPAEALRAVGLEG